jgi:hypothetical protein
MIADVNLVDKEQNEFWQDNDSVTCRSIKTWANDNTVMRDMSGQENSLHTASAISHSFFSRK